MIKKLLIRKISKLQKEQREILNNLMMCSRESFRYARFNLAYELWEFKIELLKMLVGMKLTYGDK